MNLFEHMQRLNTALTGLIASTTQIEALGHADFFEHSAVCSGYIAALQEAQREAMPHS